MLLRDANRTLSISAVARYVEAPVALSELPDEETVVRRAASRYLAGLKESVDEELVGVEDPLQQLAVRGKVYIRFALANAETYRLVFLTHLGFIGAERLDEAAALALADVAANAQACIETGRLDAGTVDASKLCLSWWATVHGLAALMITRPFDSCPAHDIVDWYIGDFIRGIAA